MASFGKLTTAFLQASQETTFTFANFNFDFAVIKYEAPKEYEGLGGSLSKRRKDAAEDGPSHVTARKLSALFQSTIPDVPNLIQAYGRRASEIATSPNVNPKGNRNQGAFADHVGADGTTIWAAATSGERAVTIHLLASILARIWTRTEAVSIWSELIDQRKDDLRQKLERSGGPVEVSDITASRIAISRSEIDDWDSSARSWLQTADEAKKLQQTQLRLILDNVSLPVSTQRNVYKAVMEAWVGAMLAMENLITGTSQRIQDGAILLGLSSWHLYPDMTVLGNTIKHIKQGDQLINTGGIITLGLHSKEEDIDKGVYWSLPLAHVRHYGDAVMATRHTGIGESRVPFDEFIFVILGSVLSTWNVVGVPLETCLDLIQNLAESLSDLPQSKANRILDAEWLHLIAFAAAQVKKLNGTTHQQVTRLVSFGQRRCAGFLAPVDSHPPAVFGLTNLKTLLATFENNTSQKVPLLRSWALRALRGSPQLEGAVIRYRDNSTAKFRFTSVSATGTRTHGKKRRRSSRAEEAAMKMTTNLVWMSEDWDLQDCTIEQLEERRCSIKIPPGPGERAESYTFMYGDADTAAIFMPSHRVVRFKDIKNEMSTTDLIACIEHGYVSATQLAGRILDPEHQRKHELYFQSLLASRQAERIYSHLPGARVELHVTSLTLGSSKWWKAASPTTWETNDRILSRIFSCIALFETGCVDVDPETIGEDVIAVSNTNSIFVAKALLLDPATAIPAVPVERITGNVGKPGLAFLISPPNPKMRKIDYASWNLVAHEKFNGKSQDSFGSTSLHLSFTGFELPLDIGMRGAYDRPAAFIETVVSIYDRGQWVADLDIMKGCKIWANQRQEQPCTHAANERADMSSWMPLVAIDSWLEFVDQPMENSIVRACGNTSARLAAAALAVQQSREILIMPIEECWQCLKPDFHSIALRSRIKNNNELNQGYEAETSSDIQIKSSRGDDLDECDGSESSSDIQFESYGGDDIGGIGTSHSHLDFDLNPGPEVVAAMAIITFIC